MYYLKEFKTGGDFESYKVSAELLTPNISYIEESNEVKYIPFFQIVDDSIISWEDPDWFDGTWSDEPQVLEKLPRNTPMIYSLDGKFYNPAAWESESCNDEDAIGVAISDGYHGFIIAPTAIYESNEDYRFYSAAPYPDAIIEGVTQAPNRDVARLDFRGELNTNAILAAKDSGVITDTEIVGEITKLSLKNGARCYVPSAGEVEYVLQYASNINKCMAAIGGDTLAECFSFATTTQKDASNWYASFHIDSNWGWSGYAIEYRDDRLRSDYHALAPLDPKMVEGVTEWNYDLPTVIKVEYIHSEAGTNTQILHKGCHNGSWYNAESDEYLLRPQSSFLAQDIDRIIIENHEPYHDSVVERGYYSSEKRVDQCTYPNERGGSMIMLMILKPGVTNLSGMFRGCTSVKEVSIINNAGITHMDRMMEGCTSLTYFDGGDLSTVVSATDLLAGCTQTKFEGSVSNNDDIQSQIDAVVAL